MLNFYTQTIPEILICEKCTVTPPSLNDNLVILTDPLKAAEKNILTIITQTFAAHKLFTDFFFNFFPPFS